MWNICKNLVYLEYPTGPGERLTPLALGSIRGYFGDDYGIFTDITDDVLTGTFEGLLGSSSGSIRSSGNTCPAVSKPRDIEHHERKAIITDN